METRIERKKGPTDEAPIPLKDFRAALPSKNKLKSQFTYVSTLEQKTFHTTHKVTEELADEIKTYYLKDNPDTAISEFEAAGAACHAILAPRYTPHTHAVYDDKLKKYVGVVSQEFPGFKSTFQDPLKEEDLNTSFIDRLTNARYESELKSLPQENKDELIEEKTSETIELVDQLDLELYELEKKSDHLERKLKKVDEVKKRLSAERELLKVPNFPLESKDSVNAAIDLNARKKKENRELASNIDDEQTELTKQISQFYISIYDTYGINKRSLDSYRIKKNLACTLTARYLLKEADLHQNNLSKIQGSIDFDMIWWPLTYWLKDSKWAVLRKPNDETFKLTARDILNFPDINDAKPYYWPTKPFRLLDNNVDTIISSTFVPLSINAYPIIANSLYQRLANDPVFVYHQFKILTRYLLLNEDILDSAIGQHGSTEKNLQEKILPPEIDRMEKLRQLLTVINYKDIGKDKEKETLVRLFSEFYVKNSTKVAAELKADLASQEIAFDASQIEGARLSSLTQCVENLRNVPKLRSAEVKTSPDAILVTKSQVVSELKEVKATAPVLSLLDNLKAVTILTLENYKAGIAVASTAVENSWSPALFSSVVSVASSWVKTTYGSRTKTKEADELKAFCEKLISNPKNPEGDKTQIQLLYNEISTNIVSNPTGAFFDALTHAQQSIEKACPGIKKSSARLTR